MKEVEEKLIRKIKGYISEEIKRILLNEENSINREVEGEATEIFDIVSKHKFTEDEKGYDEYYKCDAYNFSIRREFKGCTIDYNFTYYPNEDGVERQMNCNSYVFSKTLAMVNINYELKDGCLTWGDLYDSIQHELTHVLKGIFSFEKNRRYEPKAGNMIVATNTFCNSNNEYERIIGNVFYMGLNDEQDAYINGLYASIKKNLANGILPNQFIKETPLYKKVYWLVNIRENLDSYFSNEEFINALNRFSQMSRYKKPITKELFLKKINYILVRIKSKFLNMIEAYKKYVTVSGLMIRGDIVSMIVQQFLNFK